MPRLQTVFDTNIYIGLSDDTLKEICSYETRREVRAFASIWPCLELLAHCATRADPSYVRSLHTLRKVGRHTGYEGPDGLRVRMHEAGDNTLASGLFGKPMHERLTEHGFVAGLIRDAVAKQPETFLEDHTIALKAIASRVALEETRFARSLSELVELANGNGRAVFREAIKSDEGLRLIAETKITSLASTLGLSIDEPSLRVGVERLISAFPIPIYFLRDLLVDLLNSNMDLAKSRNRNSVWDLKLTFHASEGAAVGGVPVLLVSDDPRTRRAADSAGQQQRVASFVEYKNIISDGDVLSSRIDQLRNTA